MHIQPCLRLNNSVNLSRYLSHLGPLLVALMLFGCSSSVELTSGWSNQELRIDGNNTEWKDVTVHLAGPDVLVGIKNDNNNLYLCLITSNVRTQFQMLALGTTVWFDTVGKKNKSFGIQFPITGLLQGRRYPTRENPEDLQRFIQLAQRQLEIVGPANGERHRFADKACKGIDVHLGYADGTLTYELKVPLHKSDEQLYGINADVTKVLTIGLETGDLSDALRNSPGAPSRDSGSSGRGRSGGRSGGEGGQGPGGMGRDAPEPLKHWLIVHLAGGSIPGQQ